MSEPDLTISPIFSTPFAARQMPEHRQLNAELGALFRAREKEGTKYQEEYPVPTLKVRTFESQFTVFSWPEPCVQQLKHFCFQTLGQVLKQVNGTSDEELARLKIFNHAWFHITRPGGYMGTHNHPMASWSGVYFVESGGADPDNRDSGTLRFYDPRIATNMYMDAGNNHWTGSFQTGVFTCPATPGQLLIFPSFVMHDVAPFTGPGERVTVAFNAWIKDPIADRQPT